MADETIEKSAEERHLAFTLDYYEKFKKLSRHEVISAYGDAAHMCDVVAADIRRENTVKLGWKAGQVTDRGEAMASAVKLAGYAIRAMRDALMEKIDDGR